VKQFPRSKLHFAGTSEKSGWNPEGPYRFGLFRSLYALKTGDRSKISDPYIRQFSTYGEAQEHAEGGDIEIKAAMKVVDANGHNLNQLLDSIVTLASDPKGAKCYSSAHRSKGLEWDDVTLLNDFAKLSKKEAFRDEDGEVKEASLEEANLLYVAVTRARNFVNLNSDLRHFLSETNRNRQTEEAEAKLGV
jgi:F-box protein 18 (helicase)